MRKPLAFGQLSLEVLALLSAPDRSGQPTARICFEPHSSSASITNFVHTEGLYNWVYILALGRPKEYTLVLAFGGDSGENRAT